MIVVEKLTKQFNGQVVLNGIDLEVKEGEVVAIIGPSGSGKTTFLRCLNFLEEPTSGRIKVGDIEIDSSRPLNQQQGLVRRLRQHVGFVFQNFNLFPHLTAWENIAEAPLAHKRWSRVQARDKADELLAKVGLADKADAYPRQLSGGQQQRVAIARALALDPKVLLFDEPTSALDPELVGEVLDVIKGLTQLGVTLVIVTHEIGFAREVADHVVFLCDGQLIEEGPPEQILRQPRHPRTQAFLGKVL